MAFLLLSNQTNTVYDLYISDLRFSSILHMTGDGSLIAATLGQGIYRLCTQGNWQSFNEGLPEYTITYRLTRMKDGRLFAATNHGLYHFVHDRWILSQLQVPL